MLDKTKMTEAEVSRLVRAIEARTGILGLRVDGVSPWQLVRFEASLALQNLSPRRQNAIRSTILKSLLKGAAQAVRGIRKADYVCKTFDSALRIFDGGRYRDIYFDDILDRKAGGVKISSSDAAGYDEARSKAKIAPVFDDTSIIALSAILGRVAPRYKRHHVFEQIADAIRLGAGLEGFSSARVARVYNVFWWRVLLYRLLLARMRAKSVFAADSGQFALMRASEILGIRFTEVQHGVCTNIHPNMLPGDIEPEVRRGLLAPSQFAVYGEHSKDALSGTMLAREERIAKVGATYIDTARSVREREWKPDGPVILTVTAQGVAMEQLGTFLARFLANCGDDVVVNLKLHPAYNGDETYYRTEFDRDPRVKIIGGQSEVGTHRLIAMSHLHLSISSTCHYDALGIGTPTGILALETHESVLDIVGKEGVILINSPEGLADIVAGRHFPNVPDPVRRHFFEAGFADNMVDLIPR
ncbi:hypothetical protein HFO09_23150 [Rhizobium laguerreae]|uniref:hypothetical protein n=1 Tax=Rhizobium laguerreae TaxID=1076926 RepID=UPI001C8FAFCC|nr:hypothetical protein [Rhizobium laguerreae]MBY3257054.1 hypothetical protein [Rhizobium laguerreae]MBY3282415.1 hypothetical protein [Rhizobium laguerreae]MBY3291942.1 hypothetical protein [Rhizobium laguerreae]